MTGGLPDSMVEILPLCRGNRKLLQAMAARGWITDRDVAEYCHPQRTPFRPGRKRVRLAIRGNTSSAKTMLETRLITTWRVMAAFTGQIPEVVDAIGHHGTTFGRSGT